MATITPLEPHTSASRHIQQRGKSLCEIINIRTATAKTTKANDTHQPQSTQERHSSKQLW